ncbi:hypothetical protein SANTM175S_04157 [Streptomyces antimycoticus]
MVPARSASGGTSTWRAVSPGAWSSPQNAISAQSCQNRSSPAKCSTGIVATATPHSASEAMETRLRPTRSMTGPPMTAETTTGRVAQKETNPALAALPVVSRTNHGTAISVSELPAMETVLAARTSMSGLRSPLFPLRSLSPVSSAISVVEPRRQTGLR